MKVAFVIPIHPPHYNFVYNLLDVIEQHNIVVDIFLVFSNKLDYDNFKRKDKINHIIMSPTSTDNIVTCKKWFALEQLKDNTKYDSFIVCDAEITIIPENFNEHNIINKINRIFSNKIIYGGETNDSLGNKITRISAELISKDDRLKNITKNYSLYYWWSDLPVYKREHLSDFFNKITYNNINWYHFDHKIYLNYLILYHNFSIINLSQIINLQWSLEFYNTNNIEDLNILVQNNYGFSYITKKFYDSHRAFTLSQGSFLLYHLDR